MTIHPTAIIDSGAELDSSVSVGPYAIIGKGVRIDADSQIGPHAFLSGPLTIGKANNIGAFSCIGAPPQDIKYKGEETLLKIGDGNIIREYCSLHRGSPGGHGVTTIGSNCMLMAYSHVAHDCTIGNNVILVNNATLGGHVEIGDRVTVGGMTAVHQFSRIGEYSFIGGMSGISMDVPPYVIVAGIRNDMQVRGINKIGLKRAGFSNDDIRNLGRAFTLIFKTRELLLQEALEKVKTEIPDSAPVARMVEFFNVSNRNVVRLSSDDE
ncbi:MAG: acyl-ACP--UDP-N-acetylglucosamine O-acyltransferase [Proteobacteria bacterium]|nr:acyl-ACP--UDP-N-acetylglucosamine O-acyltransferase [Pseudomonadota bacterium]MBU4294344.1 acyl-ACP--UDP-N-acetylglucosamine O-acyltransferase [Pseudomonadota bacterium]MCG2749131.1 acyl-ACP--UDP-N-acetylglucosamine O-acyltransferase [Desulfobulbaceae bacterium]